MTFDPVNDKTHELALAKIVGDAMDVRLDKHTKEKHAPIDEEIRKQARFRVEMRAVGGTVATGLGAAWAYVSNWFHGGGNTP